MRTPIRAMLLSIVATQLALAPRALAQSSGQTFADIRWQDAGEIASIGGVVEIAVPNQCRFTDNAGAKIFDDLTQNIHNPRTLGVLLCDLNPPDVPESRIWFAHYEYDADGYVKNAASERIDADAILASIREGTEAGNEERRRRGWATMEVLGWERAPYYDSRTNNATWSLRGRASDGDVALNHRVKVLGRRGVLSVNMISAPEDYADAVAAFDVAMAGTTFRPGERYAEFREGDKVATYGLTALIAGGAGAAAAKMGLFSKLWKMIAGLFVAAWKFLAIAAIALVGWVKSLFGRKDSSPGAAIRRADD